VSRPGRRFRDDSREQDFRCEVRIQGGRRGVEILPVHRSERRRSRVLILIWVPD